MENNNDNHENQIVLERVLEYSIFTNSLAYVSPKDEPGKKVCFYVEDVSDNSFVAEPSKENTTTSPEEILANKELMVTMSYRTNALVFPVTLLESLPHAIPAEPAKQGVLPFLEEQDDDKQMARYVFSRPKTGTLTNLRICPRTSLDKITDNLKVILKVPSHLGQLHFETRHVVDISERSVALFLDRTQGRVLVDDAVAELLIYYQNDLIVESSGSIQRVDTKRVSRTITKSYFVVIRFDKVVPVKGISKKYFRENDGKGLLEKESPAVAFTEKRALERVSLAKSQPAFMDARHPLLKEYSLHGEIVDFSTAGLSFLLQKTPAPIVPGMILSEFYISLPHEEKLKAVFKVRSCESLIGHDRYGHRVGGVFQSVSLELIKTFSKLKEQFLVTHVVDAGSEDGERLWEFFFETGFIYQKKRRQIQCFAERIREINTRLLQSDNLIFKELLFKEGGEIKGHLSALKFYDHAWIVQHLMADKKASPAVARNVLDAIISFFVDSAVKQKFEMGFVTCYFRPDNLYPSLLFGEGKRIIADPKVCDTRDYYFCNVPEDTVVTYKEPADITCREASPKDLENLERLLIELGDHYWIRMEGLTVEEITSLKVAGEYVKLGLYRYRRVFVARSRTGIEAFAVCNFASPGLNLSELTNSFRLYFEVSDAKENVSLSAALAQHVLKAYAATEMPFPVLLLGTAQPLPPQFHKSKIYTYWYVDSKHFDQFQKAAKYIFENMKETLKALKLRQKIEAEAKGVLN